jgi:hypothetical protein
LGSFLVDKRGDGGAFSADLEDPEDTTRLKEEEPE